MAKKQDAREGVLIFVEGFQGLLRQADVLENQSVLCFPALGR